MNERDSRTTSALSRRAFLGTSAASIASVALGRTRGEPDLDWLITGATLLDGTGQARFVADLGIVGDTIRAIGQIAPERAQRAIDGRGLALAPGFIDLHTHSDGSILTCPTADSRVLQGVTTEITGNCGSSEVPSSTEPKSFEGYFARLRELGLSVNHGALVGHGTLRELAGAVNQGAPTATELQRMGAELERALDEGALGFSTGLEYTPGRFADGAEILELAKLAARAGALYATHMRNEVRRVVDSIDESLAIAEQSGVRLQISHLKAAGKPSWPLAATCLERLERARSRGVDVFADAYPYTAYHTGLTIYLPPEVAEGGRAAMLARLRDPATRARLLQLLPDAVGDDPGGYAQVVLSAIGSAEHQRFVGQDLAAIASAWGVAPAEAHLRLIEAGGGTASYIGHAMSEENVAQTLAHPLVLVASDGSSQSLAEPAASERVARPHPRSFGTFPRVLARYVREQKRLTLEDAVHKMTALPADRAGLLDRGRLGLGKKADLVLFDPQTIADTATFDRPRSAPLGIRAVFVNGVMVVESGRHTGARPGRVLRSGA
ncbi:MAG: D-aminoacylase [Planctomycetes bacterium]|nr:D-aminoacylase [Planctomycetota bacterium]